MIWLSQLPCSVERRRLFKCSRLYIIFVRGVVRLTEPALNASSFQPFLNVYTLGVFHRGRISFSHVWSRSRLRRPLRKGRHQSVTLPSDVCQKHLVRSQSRVETHTLDVFDINHRWLITSQSVPLPLMCKVAPKAHTDIICKHLESCKSGGGGNGTLPQPVCLYFCENPVIPYLSNVNLRFWFFIHFV